MLLLLCFDDGINKMSDGVEAAVKECLLLHTYIHTTAFRV